MPAARGTRSSCSASWRRSRTRRPGRAPMSEVLVLGASGNVGSARARLLASDGASVRAFYDPSPPQRVTSPDGVREIHGSFDDAAAGADATAGTDAVFLLTP